MGWTDDARVIRALGPSVAPDDYLTDCVNAANAWAPRKRAEAGYTGDDPDVAPSDDVAHGTTLYAVALYRERGSVDSFSSFDETAAFANVGTMGQIKRLLGIGRAAIDRPITTPATLGRGRAWVP